jgi:cysteine-rich repeat protein
MKTRPRLPRAAILAVGLLALAPATGLADPPLPKLVFSVSGNGQTICDTGCTTCTVESGECVLVDQEDLVMCRPLSTSLPITACDWEVFFDGDAPGNSLEAQLFAADVLPNGNFVFRSGGDKTLGDITITRRDLGLYIPDDVLKPYRGDGPYTSGQFKLYLNGNVTQQSSDAAPWNALEVLRDGSCEKNVTAAGPYTCANVGSLASGRTLGGVNFRDEDLLRCIPTANASGGAVTACAYAMFFEGSEVNGAVNGFTGNIQGIELLEFDPVTFSGKLVFRGPGDADLPSSSPAHDLVMYTGTFGNGICTGGGGELCAGDHDCPSGETCNTGTCTLTATACASDGDCSGSGNVCARTRTPVGSYSLFFAGNAAGLSGSGKSIQAFAIVPDGDGDDIPDGIDNCPGLTNPPEICTDGTTPCTTNADCAPGDACVQKDSDGDGVGDLCDKCNGRDDAVCFCGDGIADFPSEKCDLGAENGEPGSPCSETCGVLGTCTQSGTPCEDASDCPSGEGCCGNAVQEGDEACDDGNTIAGDACDNACSLNPQGILVLGCEDLFGPHLVPAFVRRTKFIDGRPTPGIDKWRTRGDFNLATGVQIDADSEPVRVLFNQGTSPTPLYDALLAPGSFLQGGSVVRPNWSFLDKEADVPGALGWRKGKFILVGNKVRNALDGKNASVPVDPTAPIRVRQTMRIGDVCATGVLECTLNATGKVMKCGTVVFGQ